MEILFIDVAASDLHVPEEIGVRGEGLVAEGAEDCRWAVDLSVLRMKVVSDTSLGGKQAVYLS